MCQAVSFRSSLGLIQDRKGSEALQDIADVYFVTEGGAETNTWIKVTKEFTTHEGSDRIRLSIRCGGDIYGNTGCRRT